MATSKKVPSKSKILNNKEDLNIPMLEVMSGEFELTREQLTSLLPKGVSSKVTDEVWDLVKSMGEDTQLPQSILEEDLASHVHVMAKIGGSANLKTLINAIKFCHLKRYHTNIKAWGIIFPDRLAKLGGEGPAASNHVSAYNTSTTVKLVEKEMAIPVSLQYAPYRDFAFKKLYQLANGAEGASAMVQHLSAKTLIEATAMPEEATLDIKVSASDSMLAAQREMASAMKQLVDKQAEQFAAGGSAGGIQKIHDVAVLDEESNDEQY